MEGVKKLIYSETALTLLTQLESNQITFADFMRECAYWAIKDGFDELKPLPLPTKPEEVFDYERMPKETRERLNEKYFQDHWEINSYYQQVKFVQVRNKVNFEWLNTIFSYLPEEDFINRKKVDDRLKEFIARADLPEEVKRMAAIFGARVLQ